MRIVLRVARQIVAVLVNDSLLVVERASEQVDGRMSNAETPMLLARLVQPPVVL